jgi:hypothetical protein
MCVKIYCDQCGLATWQGERYFFLKYVYLISFLGCGRHITQVLRDVPPEERCQCQKEPAFMIIQTQIEDNFLII